MSIEFDPKTFQRLATKLSGCFKNKVVMEYLLAPLPVRHMKINPFCYNFLTLDPDRSLNWGGGGVLTSIRSCGPGTTGWYMLQVMSLRRRSGAWAWWSAGQKAGAETSIVKSIAGLL